MSFVTHFKKVFLGLGIIALTQTLHALPTNPNVISGSVSITHPDGNTILVTSSSTRAIVEWDTYSIEFGERVTYATPDETGFVLNRVVTSGGTTITGDIDGNGSVYIVNEDGFEAVYGSTIMTYGFIGSTFDISNSDFNGAGDMYCFNSGTPTVNTAGVIVASGGDVALLGYQVTHSGYTVAEGGTVTLGAGVEMTYHHPDSEKLTVTSQGSQTPSGTGVDFQVNSYILSRQQEFKADGNFFETAVNHLGWTDVRGVDGTEGYLLLSAEAGTLFLNGFMTNRNFDTSGGNIDVFGNSIILGSNAYIDASGFAGGGDIQIGGGFQGGGDVPFNANDIQVSSSTFITADAGLTNNGGQVIVWSDTNCVFYGMVFARGGYSSGNGGLVEISGVNYLDYQGYIDNTGPNGTDGDVYFDPQLLRINNKTFKYLPKK